MNSLRPLRYKGLSVPSVQYVDTSILQNMSDSLRAMPCAHRLGRAFSRDILSEKPNQVTLPVRLGLYGSIILQLLTHLGLVGVSTHQVMNFLLASQYVIYIGVKNCKRLRGKFGVEVRKRYLFSSTTNQHVG